MEPNFGADLHRSTGGLQQKTKKPGLVAIIKKKQ